MFAAATALSAAACSCKSQSKIQDSTDKQLEAEAFDASMDVADAESGVDMEEGAPVQADYTTTPSGLKYRVLKKGDGKGKKPSATDVVKVNYVGKHLDGSVFDSSFSHGEPIEFLLNAVIPGWTEGVQLMQEGDTYEFYIPSALAYGPQGTPGGPIAPNEDLVFEVELLKVK